MADKQAYSKAVKGKLNFKGVKPIKKSLKRRIGEDDSADIGVDNEMTESKDSRIIENVSADEIKIVSGTGRLTSSGTTILGHGTLFMNELSHGDAIIVSHPTTFLDETKIVRMVLSNMSISISSAFSTDLISTAPFRFIKAPKDPSSSSSSGENDEKKKKLMTGKGQQDSEEAAFGEYVSQGGTKAVYRVKKTGPHGGYKMITEDTRTNTSREELLFMRSKKKSDRHCG